MIMNHNCGGTLVPMRFQIDIDIDGFSLPFVIDGFQCMKCGERVMDRDTTVSIYADVENFRNALQDVTSTNTENQTESSTDNVTVPSHSHDYLTVPV